MATIDAPRPAPTATRTEASSQVQEPPTGRALWPTFMRRTLAEDELRAAAEARDR